MADTNHKYVSEDGLTTLISLTKTELGKKANDSEVVKTINGEAPDSNGNIALDTGAGTVKSVNDVTPDEDGNLSLPQIDISDASDFSSLQAKSKWKYRMAIPNSNIWLGDPDSTLSKYNEFIENATIGDLAVCAQDNFAWTYFLYMILAALTGTAGYYGDGFFKKYMNRATLYAHYDDPGETTYNPIVDIANKDEWKYDNKLFGLSANKGDTEASLVLSRNWVTPAELTSAISALTSIKFSVVTELPTTGEDGTIYLVAHTHTDEDDSYDEYIWLSSTSKFEKIGNTDIDLSGYLKSTDVTTIDSAAVTTLWNSITA